MSDDSRSRSTTPFTELLDLTQQLTPHKSPNRTRQIRLDIQSLTNEAVKSHSALKRKLADITNQLGTVRQPRKRRTRGNRAAEAPEDVENPSTLEDRVRKTGRHFTIEYGLFPITNVHTLLAIEEDLTFEEDTEFESEHSRIQGQLWDVIALLPRDARPIRDQDWIASAFADGINNKRSTIHSRLRHESLTLIVANLTFVDGYTAKIEDFESSASRFEAFAKYIGYQPATADAAAFYSPLKAEVLFADHDGTMNVDKIFRGPLLLIIFACIIRGPLGAKGLFEGKSKLPSAKVTQRIYKIKCTLEPAIASSAVWAIWVLSADTQLGSGGEGDETQIDYKFYYETFLRQICEGLRDGAEWAVELFRYWDDVLFPNVEDSLSQNTSVNRQALGSDISAMDEAFVRQRRAAKTPLCRAHHIRLSRSNPMSYLLPLPPARTHGVNAGGKRASRRRR
ncbi:hypothetical protein C8F04DRAFT_1177944 [Mycena alexandri]|uniref:Uncharacterized protein n=1 Tax=Mycena alexandri TaxID=1745969 RepID=A0AAD6T6B1_9AGAR|nr:hypothetical protein C8F04DRAFT_1177944 [Mycena alexandri]